MKIINYFKNLTALKKYIIVCLLLFVLALIIRSIKANYFKPWGVDEMDAINQQTFTEALRWYKWHPMAPFHLSFNVIIKSIFGGSVYWQRFPSIFAGALSVALFYAILKHFLPKSRWLAILTLIPLTSFILIYYSQEIRSYALFWLLVLMSLYFSFKVLIEGSRNKIDLLALFFSFALMPIVHYLSFQHFVTLDLSLILIILLFSKRKFIGLLQLLGINFLILLSYINWSDSAYYRVVQRTFNIGPSGDLVSAKPFYFDTGLFWALIDKIVGGWPIWATIFVIFCLLSVIYLCFRLLKLRRLKQEGTNWEKFVLFMFLYIFFFLIMMKITKYSEPLNSRHHIFIIWSVLIIFSYLLIQLWQYSNRLHILTKAIAIILLCFFIGNNIVNNTAYLSSNFRFATNLSLVGYRIETMLESGQKTTIYSEVGGKEDYRHYFKNQQLLEQANFIKHNGFDTGSQRSKDVQNLINCCKDQIFFVFATNSKLRDHYMPKVDFKNLTFLKQLPEDKYLDYLNNIDASPYGKGSDFPQGHGTFMIAY